MYNDETTETILTSKNGLPKGLPEEPNGCGPGCESRPDDEPQNDERCRQNLRARGMIYYTREDFVDAYERWRKTQPLVESLFLIPISEQRLAITLRENSWHEYCDVRDGLRKGTSRARFMSRLERIPQ